jgi:hypothetical protein
MRRTVGQNCSLIRTNLRLNYEGGTICAERTAIVKAVVSAYSQTHKIGIHLIAHRAKARADLWGLQSLR